MTFSVTTLDATHSHGSIIQPAPGGKSLAQGLPKIATHKN
jgi:hypothetical protein